ncbi:MAG: sugar ABC transporter ATP-binding protein [Planctomycetaceae bacterium]|nr:sugar ABC transporter ATP-binding protein [Planctomycetaceae bacterium]
MYRVMMSGVKKSFAGVKALRGVDFRLRPGEIHALVGENGAGKSTLMKVLAGAHAMDAGEIRIDGKPVVIGTPRRGKDLGVGIVYQEFELADDLTIAENIFIDRLGKGGIIRWGKLYRDAAKVVRDLGFDLDVRAKVGDISVAYKQVVEIAKVLSANAKILILDEPTAVLTPQETEKLFATLRSLRDAGVSIVYISHRMDEVFSLCDSVTIMRDGEVTGGGRIADFTVDGMVELMIGRKLSTMYPRRDPVIGEEVLRLEGLSGGDFSGVSLTLHRGEILGLFGLVGSGRTEVVRAVFGADPMYGGTVWIDGQAARIGSPHQGVARGVALIPENRKEQGLVLDLPISHNISMTNMQSVSRWGVVSRVREEELSQRLSRLLTVKSDNLDNPADSLSGGNQQKVVIAKWLNTGAKVIIMDEPTRGVDVGAKAEIYGIINELAGRGVGILMISSELNEIIGMCDRVVVMDNGRTRGELSRDDMSEHSIMKLVVGG